MRHIKTSDLKCYRVFFSDRPFTDGNLAFKFALFIHRDAGDKNFGSRPWYKGKIGGGAAVVVFI